MINARPRPAPQLPIVFIFIIIILLSGSVFFAETGIAQEEKPKKTNLGVEEVVVTGTRIEQTNLISSSPVTQVNAEELSINGVTRLEDLLNDLPQVYESNSSTDSNTATGTATVDLRGLTPERTLVLVNGRRLPAGSPLDGAIGADLNQIPSVLVNRVEVLTGGSSAAYGSDAVSGVVNIILKEDFEGLEFDYQRSFYEHKNDFNGIQRLLDEQGFEVPDTKVSDGDIDSASLLFGKSLANDDANITLFATYRHVRPVLQGDRDYSACALGGGPGSFECAGSSTIPEGSFTDFGELGDDSFDFIVQGDQFVDRDGKLFNFAPPNYFQRPDEKFTLGGTGHWTFSEHAEVYTEIMYMKDKTTAQVAPSGNFFATDTLACGNPLLSPQQFEAICGSRGLTANDQQRVFIGRRNVEGGARVNNLEHASLRTVWGVRGDINAAWSYDAYAQRAKVRMKNQFDNDLSITRIARALDAVVDERPDSPTAGEIVCRSVIDGSDPNCVPWNIFKEGGVTPDALSYLSIPLSSRGSTEQTIVSGFVSGNLGEQGVQLPTASTGMEVVLGLEYRKESLEFNPNEGFQTGDASGQGGSLPAVDGSFSIKELFAEASLPVLEDRPYAESLGLEFAYRYSDFSTGVSTNTYKTALTWQPASEIKFRASFQHAVRHANIRELFRPDRVGLFTMASDPCGGSVTDGKTEAGRTLEECVRSGVTEDQFGNISNNEAGQYNIISGGNVNLSPEESDTHSLGLIYTPDALELSVSLDYFDIDIAKAIRGIQAELILNRCLDTGDPASCDLIRRQAGTGSLWIGDGGITSIDTNIGFLNTAGFDLSVNYELDLDDLGVLRFNSLATYLTKWDEQPVSAGEINSCVGKWGAGCSDPKPRLVNNVRTTWKTPWNINLSVRWRYIGKADDLGDNQKNFNSFNYIDLAALWYATDKITVRAGINNALDRRPQLTSDFDNGNTFPGFYDGLGRFVFAGISVGF